MGDPAQFRNAHLSPAVCEVCMCGLYDEPYAPYIPCVLQDQLPSLHARCHTCCKQDQLHVCCTRAVLALHCRKRRLPLQVVPNAPSLIPTVRVMPNPNSNRPNPTLVFSACPAIVCTALLNRSQRMRAIHCNAVGSSSHVCLQSKHMAILCIRIKSYEVSAGCNPPVHGRFELIQVP